MSVVVNILQKNKKTKKIGLNFLKSFTKEEGLYYGVPNNAYVIDEYKGQEDLRTTLFILYDQNIYGRGFSFLVKDNYDIELVLNYPSTKRDIEIFYKFIKNFCKNFKLDHFLQEDEEYSIDKIEELKEESIMFNQNIMKKMLKPNLTIFGCIYPIVLEEEFIKTLEKAQDDKVQNLFEEYLNMKQTIDCYFAKPLIYENKNDDKYLAKYVLTKDVPSIFPTNTYLPFGYNQNLKDNIRSWSVSLVDYKNDKYQVIKDISYDSFCKIIDISKYKKFDEKHIIITFDNNILSLINKDEINKAKKKMEEWLLHPNELGKKPSKLEYTNSFIDEFEDTCYIFKFKKNTLSKWTLGIVSESGTFSNMQKYSKRTEIKDAKEMLEVIKNYWKEQAKNIKINKD